MKERELLIEVDSVNDSKNTTVWRERMTSNMLMILLDLSQYALASTTAADTTSLLYQSKKHIKQYQNHHEQQKNLSQ